MQPTSLAQVPPDQIFHFARQRQAAGELEVARQTYERLLQKIPDHAESMTMLASIAYQRGDDIQGDAYVDRSIGVYRELLERFPGKRAYRAPMANLLLARDRAPEAQAIIADLDLPLNPIRATPEEFMDRRKSAMARGLPSILINTVPKSASESIWNKLAEGLGLGQCHLSMGLYPDCHLVPDRVANAKMGGLISKEHLPANPFNLKVLAEHGFDRVIFQVRDPRQATLSWAHFVHDDVSMRLMGPVWRKVVPPAGVLGGDLTVLIDWCIDQYLPRLMNFVAGWAALEADPNQPVKVMFRSFEEFLDDPETYYAQVLGFAGVDPDLFRPDAEAEVVHLRKGLTDEWRAVFTKDQQARAAALISPDLRDRFGWTA